VLNSCKLNQFTFKKTLFFFIILGHFLGSFSFWTKFFFQV